MSMQEFLEYVHVLRKRWWLFIVLCGAALGVMLVSAWSNPARYESSVRFLVNVPPSADVSLYPGYDRPTQNQQIRATQSAFLEVIQSPTVLRRTKDRLGLSVSLSELSQWITTDKPTESTFVWVAVTANDPQQAADIANTLVDEARKYFGELQAEPSASAREFISAQVNEAAVRMQAAKQALVAFKAENSISDLQAEIEAERTIIWNLTLYSSDAAVNGDLGRAASYDRLIQQHQENIVRLAALNEDYDVLRDAARQSEDYYTFLVNKETEAKLKENEILQARFIQIVEPGNPALEPMSPYDIRILALGLLVSLVVSFVLVFGLEYLERHRPKARPLTAASQATD
ncbi:MAG: YveK family protein [Anaerolineales bacterium]